MTEQAKREKGLKNAKIILLIAYFVLAYVVLHMGVVRTYYKVFTIRQLTEFLEFLNYHMTYEPMVIASPFAFRYLSIFTFWYLIFAVFYFTTRKKYMRGKEFGTAQWGGKKDIKPLIDEKEENNVIFTQTESLSLDTQKTGKNLNTLVVGGPGTGKTRFYVKPNILQAHTSYVITDPKGELLRDTGAFLQKQGYKIKVLNLVQREYSDGYHPLHYMNDEIGVLTVIYCLIENTTTEEAKSYDPFWEKAEIALLQALMYYIWYEYPKKEQNFSAVLDLLRKGEVKEGEEDYESELDQIFNRLAAEKPNHLAVRQYSIFKQSTGKTARSILISVGVRLAMFNLQEIINITARDTLELDRLGEEKIALFVIIPDAYIVLNFLAALMYTQLFETLFDIADSSPTGKLKIHVRCMLDEFANLGKLPDFERLIGTMRSREISVSVIVQNLAQIRSLYGDLFESIVGNCDSLLFMGNMDPMTLEYISTALGKETIDTKVMSYAKEPKWQRTTTLDYDILGRELMLPDELARMPDRDCVLLIRGKYPFYAKKYKLQSHKNYKFLNDYNSRYFFDYRTIKRVRRFETKVELPESRIQMHDNLEREQVFSGKERHKERQLEGRYR